MEHDPRIVLATDRDVEDLKKRLEELESAANFQEERLSYL